MLIVNVYGEGATIEGNARKWRLFFREGKTNLHDEEWSGRPSMVTDDLKFLYYTNILQMSRFLIQKNCYGLAKRLVGDPFRRSHIKAGPKIWNVPYLHGDYVEKQFNAGTNMSQWRYLQKDSLNTFYTNQFLLSGRVPSKLLSLKPDPFPAVPSTNGLSIV